MNKRGVSPLVATVLLIVFAIALGTVVMSLGRSYIDADHEAEEMPTTVCIDTTLIEDPLKILQIKYITDEISKEEYVAEAESVT